MSMTVGQVEMVSTRKYWGQVLITSIPLYWLGQSKEDEIDPQLEDIKNGTHFLQYGILEWILLDIKYDEPLWLYTTYPHLYKVLE